MRISVLDICGKTPVSRDDGAKLHGEIERLWSDVEVLEIDFESTPIASVSFFDEAIAVLALEHPVDFLKRRLRMLNLRDADRRLLNTQINLRAKRRAA